MEFRDTVLGRMPRAVDVCTEYQHEMMKLDAVKKFNKKNNTRKKHYTLYFVVITRLHVAL